MTRFLFEATRPVGILPHMRTLLRPAVWGLLWLAFSAASFATTLTVTGHPEDVNGGGEFTAYLNNNSNATFDVFCIDYRNFLSGFNTSFDVNISTLSFAGLFTNSDVQNTRYGTTPSNNFSFDVPQAGTAENRYLLAAYLTTQFDFSSGVNAADFAIQDAIWNLLDVDGADHTANSTQSAVDGEIAAALAWELSQNSVSLANFASRVEIFTSTDVANWQASGCSSRYSCGQQEYIMVAPNTGTPEPADLAMVGAGLVGLGLLRRRRAA